jgi:hypothetical protein
MWILGSVVDPEEFEGLDRDRALAIDGRGGTYEPTDPLVIGGDGLDLSGTNHVVSGKLTVASLALISIADGGEIKAEGASDADIRLRVVSNVARLEVGSGAVVQVKAGAALDVHGSLTLKQTSGPGSLTAESGTSITLADGSTLTAADGSQVYLNGDTEIGGAVDVIDDGSIAFGTGAEITGAAASLFPVIPAALLDWDGRADFADLRLKGSSWPTLSSARNWERHSLDVAFCTNSNANASTGPFNPDIWPEPSDLSTSMCLRTRAVGGSGDYSVVELKGLPQGATLANVKVKSKGVNNTAPVYPTYQIVRWIEGDALQSISDPETDIHDSLGSWDTLSRTTTIEPSSAHTIDCSYRYGVKITHPYPSGGIDDSSVRIYDVGAYGTTTTMRSN